MNDLQVIVFQIFSSIKERVWKPSFEDGWPGPLYDAPKVIRTICCEGDGQPLHLSRPVRLHGGVRGGVQGGDRLWRVPGCHHDNRSQEENKLPPSPDLSPVRCHTIQSVLSPE